MSRRVLIFAASMAVMNALRAAPAEHAAPVWESLAPMPAGNAGFAHVEVDGKIVVAGGTTWVDGAKVVLDTAWSFAPDANRWTSLGRLPRRFAFGGFGRLGRAPFLLAGDDGARTWSDGFAFFPSDGIAKVDELTLSHPVAYVGSVSDGEVLYLLGGTPDLRDLTRLQDGFLSVDHSGAIKRLPDFPGGPVMHAALVALGGAIYVFPGGTYDREHRAAANTRNTWRFLLRERRWEELAPYPFPVRGLGACTLDQRCILVGGGFKTPAPGAAGSLTAECFVFDTERLAYSETAPLPTAAMLVGFERVGNSVYAFGGEDGDRHRSAGMFRAGVAALVDRSHR
jgi:hypothetical protein